MSTALIAPSPTSNYAAYRACCAEAAEQDPWEWTFKSDPRYRQVLEHVTQEQGEELLRVAEEADPKRWSIHRANFPKDAGLNDKKGAPILTEFSSLGIWCSPSNCRYLAHAILIWTHLERLGLEAVHLVELGGGYGGLALYVHWLQHEYPTRLASYTIVDVPEACNLLDRYAREEYGLDDLRIRNGVSVEEMATALPPDDGLPRYFISAFAFSEFDQETRDWYQDRLVTHCQHGFMIWNFQTGPYTFLADRPVGGPLYPFTEAPLTIAPERPATGPGNVVVTW